MADLIGFLVVVPQSIVGSMCEMVFQSEFYFVGYTIQFGVIVRFVFKRAAKPADLCSEVGRPT